LRQYRGIAYSIGADNGVCTFPNIIKQFTTSLIGASTGIGDRNLSTNGLNAGVNGAVNKDMAGQAQWLVNKLKSDTRINFNNDWKVVTIWIGSNNLCALCKDKAANDGLNFESQVTAALNIFYKDVPRLFVNLVAPLNVASLYGIGNFVCNAVHNQVCPCIVGKNDQLAVGNATLDMTKRAYKISEDFNKMGRKDFAVVVQPFLVDNKITDRSLLSTADCFHPSAKGHILGSIALWNNMVTPRAQKKTTWNEADAPICPTKDTLLYTN